MSYDYLQSQYARISPRQVYEAVATEWKSADRIATELGTTPDRVHAIATVLERCLLLQRRNNQWMQRHRPCETCGDGFIPNSGRL